MRLRRDRDAQEAFFRTRGLPPDPPAPAARDATIGDLADTVDYLVNVCGGDHVGLGGDVNGIDAHQWPAGMDHVGELSALTVELLRRGYTAEQLEKLLCRNWLRVFRQCLPP